jgi:hypothetical protein
MAAFPDVQEPRQAREELDAPAGGDELTQFQADVRYLLSQFLRAVEAGGRDDKGLQLIQPQDFWAALLCRRGSVVGSLPWHRPFPDIWKLAVIR